MNMLVPPEIYICIGQFLSPQDLASCNRVSKSWHQVFVPLLYHSVDDSLPNRPSFTALREYKHHLREAKVAVGGSYFGLLCNLHFDEPSPPNLKNLYLQIVVGKFNPPSTAQLLKSTPGLQALTIDCVCIKEMNFPWYAILDYSFVNLQELHLKICDITKDTFQFIGRVGSTLRILCFYLCGLEAVNFSDLLTTTEEHPLFPNISKLSMVGTGHGSIDLGLWLTNSPRLRTLVWGPGLYSNTLWSTTRLFSTMLASWWSNIQSLSLGYHHYMALTDSELSQILDLCAPLTKFVAPNSGFSIRSFNSLERHFLTLQDLELSDADGVQSWMNQEILSSCPRLINFRSTVLFACDLVQDEYAKSMRKTMVQRANATKPSYQGGEINFSLQDRHFTTRYLSEVRPWVCLGLKVLTLAILQMAAPWHEPIFKRISTLNELRTLNLDVAPKYRMAGSRYLEFNLYTGMRHLESLRHLEELKFKRTHQMMQEWDVRWMLDSWPRLRDLTLDLHGLHDVNIQLCKIVHDHISRHDAPS